MSAAAALADACKRPRQITKNNKDFVKAVAQYRRPKSMAGGQSEGQHPRALVQESPEYAEQLRKGYCVELEHGSLGRPNVALSIAMDHLAEFPNYYTLLAKMERDAKRKLV